MSWGDTTFNSLLAVFIGGGMGSLLRWWISIKLNPFLGAFSIGTLLVNLSGAFMIGLCMAFFNRIPDMDPVYKTFIVTGFCGGLTTFSTFSFEAFDLIKEGKTFFALLYIFIHLLAGLLMTFLGFILPDRG